MPSTSQVGLERFDLASVGVAPDGDVHQREQRLAAEHPLGEHDHARARSEDRHAVSGSLPDGLHQVVRAGELRDRRGLASRDHEALHVGELAPPFGPRSPSRRSTRAPGRARGSRPAARGRRTSPCPHDRSRPPSSAFDGRPVDRPTSSPEVPEPSTAGDEGDDPRVQCAPERLGRGRIAVLLRREERRIHVDRDIGNDDGRPLAFELTSEARFCDRRRDRPGDLVAERHH